MGKSEEGFLRESHRICHLEKKKGEVAGGICKCGEET
jgi:hypothetical protein